MEIKKSPEYGFTLIDVTIIMIVAGLVLMPIISAYSQKIKNEAETLKISETLSIAESLEKYALRNGAYPLPANPTLDTYTDTNHGNPVTSFPSFATGQCNSAGIAVNGVICRPGNRNIAGGGGSSDHEFETVLIGSVPVSAIGLTANDALDKYGNKYIYAVSAALVNTGSFEDDRGVIRIRSGNDTSVNVQNTDNRVHFVVISPGENSNGAYKGNGTRNPCATTPSTLEIENCNDDGIFTALTDATNNYRKEFNLGTTSNYFDDVIAYETSIMGRFWTPTDADVMNMTSSQDMLGRVSIGHLSNYIPRAQLDVNGAIRADELVAPRICNENRSECFEAQNIVNDSPTSPTFLKCGSFGLKQVVALNKTSATNASNASAGGICDPETKVSPTTDFGSASADGTVCENGSFGLDALGKLQCR
jgi:Tfp pilus assembly protein PilE